MKRKLFRKGLKAAVIAALLLLASACSAVQALPGQNDSDNSSVAVEEEGLLTEAASATGQPAIEDPKLISPRGILNSPTPTYVWKAVADSQYYCLEVKEDGGDVVLRQWYNASDLSSTQCSVAPQLVLNGGDYAWRVQSWSCSGYKWSEEMQFSVCKSTAYPGKAALVSPRDVIGSKNPTFVWKSVAGCTQYCLKVASANDLSHPLLEDCYDAEEVLSGDLCSITPDLNLAAGTYRWWIQTRNCKGNGPWSNFLSFKYQNRPPGICTPLLPNGLLSTSKPRFVWTAASGATQYHLQLDNRTTTILEDWYDAAEVTSGSRCSAFLPIALPDDDALYFWRIRAENDAGNGPWSSFKSFQAVCPTKKGNENSSIDGKAIRSRTVLEKRTDRRERNS